MEEERRLAYVAITRAKQELYMLHTRNRLLYGQTMYNPVSRFVSEIPSSLVERPDEDERRGDFGGGAGFGRPFGGNGVGTGFGRASYGGSIYGARGAESAASQKRKYYSEPVPRTAVKQTAPSSGERLTVGKPLTAQKPQGTKELFQAGDRVRHMTFGEGEIISVRPMGADTLYEIVFERVGTKKLMATYAKLKKL